MIDTFVTFHVLPGRIAEFERLHQKLPARRGSGNRCEAVMRR